MSTIQMTPAERRLYRALCNRGDYVYVDIRAGRRSYHLSNGRRVYKRALDRLIAAGHVRVAQRDITGQPMQWWAA